jgi:hypothetical protein
MRDAVMGSHVAWRNRAFGSQATPIPMTMNIAYDYDLLRHPRLPLSPANPPGDFRGREG